MRLYEGLVDADDYLNFLKAFHVWDLKEKKENFHFTYHERNCELGRALREKFDYAQLVAEQKNELRIFVGLLQWVFHHLHGNGMCELKYPVTAMSILTLSKELKIESNCYMYAVVLTELLLSLGYCARTVRCMPIDLCYSDCHCMTEVFSREADKWIALDPANKAYYVDSRMQPLSIWELREVLREEKKLIVPYMGRERLGQLREYLVKNFVRFEAYKDQYINCEEEQGERVMYHLQPLCYRICDKRVVFDGFAIKHIFTGNPALFWESPE